MEHNVLWMGRANCNSLSAGIRIVDLGGDIVMETISSNSPTFWERVRYAWKYVRNSETILMSMAVLNKGDLKELVKVAEYVTDKENSSNQ